MAASVAEMQRRQNPAYCAGSERGENACILASEEANNIENFLAIVQTLCEARCE